MGSFENLKVRKIEDILKGMHEGEFSKTTDVPFLVAESLIELKMVEQLCEAIKATGSNLFKASTSLKESSENSVETLKKSIDEFRKSNERTSKALTTATYILAFVALVQAAIFAYPLLSNGVIK
jgi:prefoldin subunit 5